MSFNSHKSRALERIARLSAKAGHGLDSHFRRLGNFCHDAQINGPSLEAPEVSHIPMVCSII